MLKSKLNWKSAPIPAENGTAKWKDYCIWYISLIFSNGPKKLGSKHGGGGSFRHRLKCYGIKSTPLRPELCSHPAAWYTIPCARFRLRRLVGYFWRAFRGISAPFCSEFFTTSFFLVRIILPDFPRLGRGLGQGRKPAAQKLRRSKQRIAAFSHCCQRHSASGSFCVYAKIRRINT